MDRKIAHPVVGVVGLTEAEQRDIRGGSGRAQTFLNSINTYRNSLRGSGALPTRSQARTNSALGYARKTGYTNYYDVLHPE